MPPASNEATSLTGTLEIARRDLLDLGLRNTLLNYRPLRSKGIEVIDERPIEVFQLLVKEEKSLTFLSGDAVGPHSNGSTTDVQLAQPEDEVRPTRWQWRRRLQTSLCVPRNSGNRCLHAQLSIEAFSIDANPSVNARLGWPGPGAVRDVPGFKGHLFDPIAAQSMGLAHSGVAGSSHELMILARATWRMNVGFGATPACGSASWLLS
jgi:hypothetical protein